MKLNSMTIGNLYEIHPNGTGYSGFHPPFTNKSRSYKTGQFPVKLYERCPEEYRSQFPELSDNDSQLNLKLNQWLLGGTIVICIGPCDYNQYHVKILVNGKFYSISTAYLKSVKR